MKKTIATLLALVMVLSMAACGASDAPAAQAPAEKPAETTAAPAEDTTAPTETEAPTEPPVVYDYQNELVGVNIAEVFDFYSGFLMLEVTNLTDYDLYVNAKDMNTYETVPMDLAPGQTALVQSEASSCTVDPADENVVTASYSKPIFSLYGAHVGDIHMEIKMRLPEDVISVDALDSFADLETLKSGAPEPIFVMENENVKVELLSAREEVREWGLYEEEPMRNFEFVSLVTNRTPYDLICVGGEYNSRTLVPAGETVRVVYSVYFWYLENLAEGETFRGQYVFENMSQNLAGYAFFDCNLKLDENGVQVGGFSYDPEEGVDLSLDVSRLETFEIHYYYNMPLYSGEYYDIYLDYVDGTSTDGEIYDGAAVLRYVSKAPEYTILGDQYLVGDDEGIYYFSAGRTSGAGLPFSDVRVGDTLTLDAEQFQGWDRYSEEIYFSDHISLTITIDEEPNASVSVN